MVNAPKKNLSPNPVRKYGTLKKLWTQRCHPTNEGQSGLEEGRVRAVGALHSLRYKKKRSAEKRRELHIPNNEEKEQWIEDNVDGGTAVAWKPVQDAETAIVQN